MGVFTSPPEGGRCIHIYCPEAPTINRLGLIDHMSRLGWHLVCVDPHDLGPIHHGMPDGDWILAARSAKAIETALGSLGPKKPRVKIARPPMTGLAECSILVTHPFDAHGVFGSLESLESSLGRQAVMHLKKAQTAYAINSARGVGAATREFMTVLAAELATLEKGHVLELK